mgnify:FL=1|tara:strand:+ start:34 stop:888 length:855 start_codon:yes stop_codon:yes gene_type:complete
MDRGYFIFAQGKEYIRNAYALALSIKNTQTINSVCVAVGPDDVVPVEYEHAFDHVVMVKNVGLKDPMANEWQIWDLTPYKETIHVEADMIFTSDIDWWWQELQQHDLFFTSHVKDYRGNRPASKFYRKHFNKKTLPHLYNGFYYFKYSETAHKFFNKVKEVSARYKWYAEYFFAGTWYPETPTTDEIFGITAHLLDLDDVVYNKNYTVPYFTHMKTKLQDWKDIEVPDENWMRCLSINYSKKGLNIGGFMQQGPFHYQNKLFLTDKMIDTMKEIYNERRTIKST